MVSHWFSVSRWQLPNEKDSQKMQELFTQIAGDKHRTTELVSYRITCWWMSTMC